MISGERHGEDYLKVLRTIPEVQLLGVAEAEDAPTCRARASRELAERNDLPLLGLAEALATCEAVVICSEVSRHAALTANALAGGCHVLVDKPPALSAREFEAATAAASESTTQVLSCIHRLLSPALVRARRNLAEGAVGLPLSIDVEWIASGGMDGTTVESPELVCDPRLSGGGELSNFGWYPVLAVANLTGLSIVEVFAFGGALFGGPHASYGVEDTAVLSLLLERGATATITISRVPAGISTEAVSSSFRIVGSHGALTFDEAEAAVRLRRTTDAAGGRLTVGGDPGDRALRACFDEFLAAVRGERPTVLGIAEMTEALAVIDAARMSLRSSVPVPVRRPSQPSQEMP